ncbi:hypothetical protein TRIP_B50393 [uncultured Desulfatiglans sp.]|uniref:Radical SAM core domain-containing protein n=1 Tax=Uncultured Desulfatiglans sp. TaxID=1748965 RepID=A0A653AHU3_UNCDX|nr:hypothetical protein TRIP_B50393 [uncultured Desulfatiglans sp.]
MNYAISYATDEPDLIVPVSSFLLKLTNQCNFNCDYCYFRHKADQSYTLRPSKMSKDTISHFASSLGDYINEYGLKCTEIIFHGGEPLILGKTYLKDAVHTIRSFIPENCTATFSIQTNASLLNDEIVKTLHEQNVMISASLDGPEKAQNRHRRFSDGKNSFDVVTTNIKKYLLDGKGRDIYSGLLAVIDIQNKPLDVFKFLQQYTINKLDFLLPDGTYDCLPPGITQTNFKFHREYADWLIEIFDYWFEMGVHQPQIRFFENIISLILGGQSEADNIGKQRLFVWTIQTDGEIQDNDVLGIAYENAARFGAGHFIGNRCFQTLLRSTDFKKQRQIYSSTSLNSECAACYWREICGGGVISHRFSSKNGYNNPSIYCGNIRALLEHIRNRVKQHLEIRCDAAHNRTDSTASEQPGSSIPFFQSLIGLWDIPVLVDDEPKFVHLQGQDDLIKKYSSDHAGSVILSPEHTRFWQSIDGEIAKIIKFLVHRLNAITFSSCQGHRLSNGGWTPRYIKILCRQKEEFRYLNGMLKNAANAVDSNNIQVKPVKVSCENEKMDAIEIIFLPQVEDPEIYFSCVDLLCETFLAALNAQVNPRPSQWKIPTDRIHPTISMEQVRATFSDYFCRTFYFSNRTFYVDAIEPLYRNEYLAFRHYAHNSNIAIFNNHAWALPFWIHALRQNYDRPNYFYQIIHMDYHSDLMSPRISFSPTENLFMDFFTGKSVDFDREETLEQAIYSTAIGPGGFILPFFYLYRHLPIRFDHIYPDSGRDLNNTGTEKEIYEPGPHACQISIGGPPILGQCGPTLCLEKDPENNTNLTLSHLNAGRTQYPEILGDVIILDIDLDFFSNKMRGSSEWLNLAGWHPNEEEFERLVDYTRTLLRSIASRSVPVIVTIATSNSFCPPETALRVLEQLEDILHALTFTKTAKGC